MRKTTSYSYPLKVLKYPLPLDRRVVSQLHRRLHPANLSGGMTIRRARMCSEPAAAAEEKAHVWFHRGVVVVGKSSLIYQMALKSAADGMIVRRVNGRARYHLQPEYEAPR